MTAAALRRVWIVRYLLLWTTRAHTPRVDAQGPLGLAMAYTLRGYSLPLLQGDLRFLHAAGLLVRNRCVYWLADPRAAQAWALPQPETAREVANVD